MQTDFYRALEQTQLALGTAAAPLVRAQRAATVLAQLAATRTATAEPACRAGCAHCCHHPVGITFPEAVALAAAIRALPAALATAVTQRVVATAASTRALPWDRLGGLPCPLLADERCLVHGVRPIACRAWSSTDAGACAAAAMGRPTEVPFDRAAFAAGLGVGAALAADPGAPGHRELRSALAAVLTAGSAAAPAFASARNAGADGATAAPAPHTDAGSPPA